MNLQAGNVLVNFDLPWNPMIVEQRIGRVQRLGSRHARVEVVNLVLRDSYEQHIVAVLMEKLQVIAHTLGDVEALLEAAGMDDQGGQSLEAHIRKMVLASLHGQDMRNAASLKARSIEEARELLETQHDELDQSLGRLDDLHRTGTPMPRLEPVRPRMPADEFTRAALQARGGTVRKLQGGLWELRTAGEPTRRIAFDEATIRREQQDDGVFMGNAPVLYQPGSRDFERLTQHWCENYAADVRIPPPANPAGLKRVAQEYCESIEGAAFQSHEVTSGGGAFDGTAVCRAKVGNGVDSYETLIDIPVRGDLSAHEAIGVARAGLSRDIDPSRVFPGLRSQVDAAVRMNQGIRLFFDHYAARLKEELVRAGHDPALERRLMHDFEPVAFAEIVGLQGVSSTRTRLEIEFSFDRGTPYRVELEIGPDGRSVKNAPARSVCEISGKRVPNGCLGRCEATGKRVLRHLLVPSEASGALACPDAMVRCEETGRTLLPTETARCEASGRHVDQRLLEESTVSGRRALPSQTARCDESKRIALPEELVRCALSGRRVHPDLTETCVESGKAALRSRMVRSDVSGMYVLPKHAVRSQLSRREGTRKEAARCAWGHDVALIDELKKCSLTGARVAGSCLDSRHGALRPLVALLEDPKKGIEDRALAEELRTRNPVLAKLAALYVLDHDGPLTACCGRTGGFFGLGARWFAFVIDREHRIVGHVAICKKQGSNRWEAVARA